MTVKIFLPSQLFYVKENCDIFGEIQINENNAISYFIVGCSTDFDCVPEAYKRLRHLGHIASPGSDLQQRDVSLSFTYDSNTPNIYISKLSIKPTQTAQVSVFLYNVDRVLQLHSRETKEAKAANDSATGNQCDDIRMLYHLLQECQKRVQPLHQRKHSAVSILWDGLSFPLIVMTRLFILLMEWQPLVFLLKHTVLHEHYQEWKKFRATGKRKANIALDKLLGIFVMLMLLFLIPHPGDFLIQTSHLIIRKLRLLLRALKGSPIGLKLNVHLNNFFLDCFNYHIDLWATFLDLIEPFVRHLFVPIALFGAMGLTFQLALLADLISVVGLHAHCFYIYAAVLYKVEIKGLQVLWKVVLGKRHNLLKNRVESHNYMNRQLYLATIFFTSLLFLFPTILVYYIVFTTLRLCIYLANLMLQLKRRRLLEFPLHVFFKWLTGSFFEMESIHLQHLQHRVPSSPQSSQMRMCVFEIDVQSSSLARVFSCESGVLKELKEQTSLKSIFNRILEGKF